MVKISKIMNDIWRKFQLTGIVDDFAIIENVTTILTGSTASPTDELYSRMSSSLGINTDLIQSLLNEAIGLIKGGKAELFDFYVLFRLPERLPGGRYPTPRHIVRFIHRICRVEPHHTLADFACGSGGFLVARECKGKLAKTVGCEISSEWAWLARANCNLHNLPEADIRLGNALQVTTGEGLYAETIFDRILMNPPFGVEVDSNLVQHTLGEQVGTRSETVLTRLALNKLAEDGRAAILLPAGVLFSNSTAERRLRNELLDHYHIEAVITLPKDALQPYSQTQTNLLLALRREPGEDALTWFFRLDRDGYPAGRGRDLTQQPDPKIPNDLPLAENAFIAMNTLWDQQLPPENPLFGIRQLMLRNDKPLGINVGAFENFHIDTIEYFAIVPEPETPFILIKFKQPDELSVWMKIDVKSYSTEVVESRTKLLQNIFKKKIEEVPRKILLSGGPYRIKEFALSADIRILGVRIPQTFLKEGAYDLRPERYVPVAEEEHRIESPASLLAEIWQNQRRLMQRINNLMSRLDMPPIASEDIPPPLETDSLQLIGQFSGMQKTVWDIVRQQITNISRDNESNRYSTAEHFSLSNIEAKQSEDTRPATRETLELLEKMGLIVPVTVISKMEQGIAGHRLVTRRDYWEESNGQPDNQDNQEL